MPDNGLAPPNMPWLWQPNSPVGQPNGLGPPMLNYAAPPNPAAPTVGQGVAQTAADVSQALPSWPSVEEQRRMLQPLPGWQGTAVDAAKQWAEGVMMGTTAPGDVPPPGIVAYHGSPADFDRFDDRFIGTGEGAQAYGRGHYFGGAEETGRSYRDALTPETIPNPEFNAAQQDYNAKYGAVGNAAGATDAEFNAAIAARDAAHEKMKSLPPTIPNPAFPGSMYQVNIGADPEHFLDWDKPRDALPTNVQAWAKENYPSAWDKAADGSSLYSLIVKQTQSEYPGATKGYMPPPGFNAHAQVTQEMANAGIPGIRYLDQGSRSAGQGSHNYVVFDANTIDILRKYGIAGLIAGGGAAAAATQQQQPSQ